MPHPKGMIRVSYDLGKKKSQAVIELPNGVSGTFFWKGKSYELQGGKHEINLN